MKRKIIRWESYRPPLEWTPVLECGHKVELYEGGLSDAIKSKVEEEGTYVCFTCARAEEKIQRLETELAEARRVLDRHGAGSSPASDGRKP